VLLENTIENKTIMLVRTEPCHIETTFADKRTSETQAIQSEVHVFSANWDLPVRDRPMMKED
jgi:hypothetical protein